VNPSDYGQVDSNDQPAYYANEAPHSCRPTISHPPRGRTTSGIRATGPGEASVTTGAGRLGDGALCWRSLDARLLGIHRFRSLRLV